MKGGSRHNLTIYITDEEREWIKAQGRGYVRMLVREDMPPKLSVGQQPDAA